MHYSMTLGMEATAQTSDFSNVSFCAGVDFHHRRMRMYRLVFKDVLKDQSLIVSSLIII